MHQLQIHDGSPLVTALDRLYHQSRSARLLYRLLCLVLVSRGVSCYQVAA